MNIILEINHPQVILYDFPIVLMALKFLKIQKVH